MHDLGCVCGRHFRRVLYHSIDVTQHPGLRYAVLAGVLNTVQCPSCERIARVNLPFLYSDTARRRLSYVYPTEIDDTDGETRRQIVATIGALEEGEAADEGLPRPNLMFGLERLAELIAEDMSADEEPGSISFDVRPGIKPERAARVIASRVALQAGAYVYDWREGGRLHLQIVGPRALLEQMTISIQ